MSELTVPKISVIIPCYKAVDFLPRTIECFAAQTFQDFEIILVNDGDKQQLPIMQQLQRNNAKIRIINKEKNGGISSARNAGMDAAQGEWIVFTDQDDEEKSYYLQSLYEAVTKNKADIAIGGYTVYFMHTKKVSNSFFDNNLCNKSFFLPEIYESIAGNSYTLPWNKIFNVQFLKQSHCYFPKATHQEDRIFFSSLMLATNPKIALCRDCGYVHLYDGIHNTTSHYIPTLTHDILKSVSLDQQVLEKIGWNESRKGTFSWLYYMAGFNMCCNFFKKGSPLSFIEQIKAIRRDILQNDKIMHATKIIKMHGSLSTKIYNITVSTHNAFLMALGFRLYYWSVRHLYSPYFKIKRLLKGK